MALSNHWSDISADGALVSPKDGLCNLVTCTGRTIFYFPEFRDTVKKSGERQVRWNGKVLFVDPVVSFANEVLLLSSALTAAATTLPHTAAATPRLPARSSDSRSPPS